MSPPRFLRRYENRLLLLALAGGLPAVVLAIIFLLSPSLPGGVRIPSIAALLVWLLAFAAAIRRKAAFPWRTMSSMLGSIREGDYSIRARVQTVDDVVGEALEELNLLGESLRTQRLGRLEATTLLRKVLEEIDVAIFDFDDLERLRLVNRAGVRLLARPVTDALGMSATDLELGPLLRGETERTVQRTFPGGSGRWAVRRTDFREGGRPHVLLVLSDLTRELREEELQAWQRLVRVLGHELNNSLAPVQSIAHSVEALVCSDPLPADWREDVVEGLRVIATRSESLSRFIGSYAKLARLPKPLLQPVDLGSCVSGVLQLDRQVSVQLLAGPETKVLADCDQVEQLLINLLQNAADAVAANGGAIRVGWRCAGPQVELWVEDEGEGLSSDANLFVPFFTTKPGGSGIGLVLCRKIAEGHNGSLTLENRAGAPGCIARLRLPVAR